MTNPPHNTRCPKCNEWYRTEPMIRYNKCPHCHRVEHFRPFLIHDKKEGEQ